MDTAEQLVRDRGLTTPGITVGLFDEYGVPKTILAEADLLMAVDGYPTVDDLGPDAICYC